MEAEITNQNSSSSGVPKKLKSCLKKTSFRPTPLETHAEKNEDDDGLTKREKLQMLIKKKKECDAKAKKIVHSLIEVNVDKQYLLESAGYINVAHWEDIVEERRLSNLCGWALCDNNVGNVPKQQYLLRCNRVYDITERKSYCSGHCYAISDHFKNQLLLSPLWMRDEEPIPEFVILEDKNKKLHGIELGLNKLSLDDVSGDEDDPKDEKDDE